MDTKNKIAVCSRSFSRNSKLREELSSLFENVKYNDDGLSLKGESLIGYLQGYDGAIVALEVIDQNILAQLPSLKFIGKYGVGLDMLDFDALEEANVKLGWTPGVNAQSVAELTVTFALNLIRNIPVSNKLANEGEWRQITGKQISSLTYGILGCGHAGKALVKILSGFGCKILACDIEDYSNFYKQYDVESVSLDELLRQSDILSMHLPKNKTTIKILNSSEIAKMKKGAYLINTARGGLVDEGAVLEALDSNHLSGVAFDVLEEEPPQDLYFIRHPKSFVTTHIGGSSEEAILAMGKAAIQGLIVNYPANIFSKYK